MSHRHPKFTLPSMNPPSYFPASPLGFSISVNVITRHQSSKAAKQGVPYTLPSPPLFLMHCHWNGQRFSLLISVNSPAFGAHPYWRMIYSCLIALKSNKTCFGKWIMSVFRFIEPVNDLQCLLFHLLQQLKGPRKKLVSQPEPRVRIGGKEARKPMMDMYF